MKRILCAFLISILCLVLFSCLGGGPEECTAHVDENKDGKCDVCEAVVEKPEDDTEDGSELILIEGGEAKFQLVISKSSSNSVVQKAAKSIVDALDGVGVEIKQVSENADNAAELEVIIGSPTERGADYLYDVHELGPKGYAIKVIKGKILILGGSDDATVEAVEVFIEEILGIDKKTKELDTVAVKASDSIEEIQDDYRITSLKLDGEDMKGYTIATDLRDKTLKAIAENIQSTVYAKAGYWFELVSLDKADKSIVIKVNPNTYEGDGYYVDVKDGQLIFETEFPNKLADRVAAFLATNITVAEGEVDFTSKTHKSSTNVRVIYYEDFGAKSKDGMDDFDAFKKTHDYANEWGHSVKAKAGGEYLFGKGSGSKSIVIKTDTDWNGCKFIFDDSNIVANVDPEFFIPIFIIQPEKSSELITNVSKGIGLDVFAHVTPETPWIDEGDNKTTNIGYKPGKKILLYITSDERKQYIRYGNNQNSGSNQQEVIIVDAEGNIDPSTPLQWTYTRITTARAYSATERPITVGNCRIEQKMNRSPSLYNYASRNIVISRSNTLLTDVNHQIVDEVEGDSGSEPYTGFVVIENCDNATVRNYTFKGPKSYYTENSTSGLRTIMGSYGSTASRCTNVTWDHVVQTDYRQSDGLIVKNGSHGSNYCKNLALVNGSALSLFDAHCGTYNAKVTDSEIVSLNLIGEGLLYMENVNLAIDSKSHYSIGLREDYGCTWKGEVIVKDCTVDASGAPGMTDYSLFRVSSHVPNHNFGYPCYFPQKITVDGLKYKGVLSGTKIHLAQWLETKKEDISVPSSEGGAGGINPYYGCAEIYFKNCDMNGWVLPNTPQFKNMTVFVNGEQANNWKSQYGSK